MTRKFAIAAVLATGIASVLGHAPALAQGAKEVNFGIIATESTQNLKSSWGPLLEDMQKRTGIKVNAFFASDYAGIIEAMRFNKVQIAWYGNKSAMEAVDRASGEVFVQTLAKDGAPGYWSLLVVHRDSPLRSIEDVVKNSKALTLGFGDPNSTSGNLVPGYYAFAMNKLDPRKDFKGVRAANHETNLLAVANRHVDLATNNNESLDRLKATAPEKAALVREIWRSPLIAADPIVWRRDLAAEIKQPVKEFLTGYGRTEAEKSVLRTLGLAGFRLSSDAQLIPTRQLELVRDKNKLEADTAMAPAEKQAKLAQIEARLSELNRQLVASK